MEKEILKNTLIEPCYVEELVEIIRSDISEEEMKTGLLGYHSNDIADALEDLTPDERKKVYRVLGPKETAEIFSYIENPTEYLVEIKLEESSSIISQMDSDDAVDLLEKIDSATSEKLISLMDPESSQDVRLILSFDNDEIGSKITTNFIVIKKNMSVRQAMRELISQAGENDNISMIYVVDEDEHFYGAVDLKDLIVAREDDRMDNLISTSYPYVKGHYKISDCIERIKDYAEDSIPVLNDDGKIIGIITADDIIEVVDDELGEDYAKLAGLTAEEDINETMLKSIKKRLPWLIILLFLGLLVSSVVGIFEPVVAILPIIISFQSLILDMSGNVGTQSLAVTIRVLMHGNLKAKQKRKLIFKETRVGLVNGLLLGVLAFIFTGIYVFVFRQMPLTNAFLISGCVGVSLVVAMAVSSLVGTVIPMFFHKIKIDPAVASGPLITTVNDLVAVLVYYSLSWVFLINIFKLI